MKKLNRLVNTLDDFIDSEYFQEQVENIRRKFQIPKNGFNMPKEEQKNIKKYKYSILYVPKELLQRKKEILKPFNLLVKDILKKFPINDTTIRVIFNIYIFHNKKIYILLNDPVDEVNLCRVESIKDEIEEYEFLAGKEEAFDIIKNKFDDYPVIIKLYPNISQNELIYYIKRNWEVIKKLHLNHYADRGSKFSLNIPQTKGRNLKIKERNDFIYKSKLLPRKKIMKLVSDKFNEVLDVGHIGKIISIENKRRKKV